ncbi:MAG TPA: Arm DNA-binding domain-containing protein [Acidobacteriaceae bacterium]|nr:Arm DNA-binding domain-containing protein [Acidobacteriaceae bacterium]
MALTDTVIRKAKAKDAAYRLSDGGGLYLQVTPAGGKLWRWKYRFEGREKLMTFGSYPDVSLSQARERHATARKRLATGTDPMAERKAEKAAAEDFLHHPISLEAQSIAFGPTAAQRHKVLITRRGKHIERELRYMVSCRITAPGESAGVHSCLGGGSNPIRSPQAVSCRKSFCMNASRAG